MRCYWEHVGEHIGNLGTYWEKSENLMRIHWEQQKSKPLTNLKKLQRREKIKHWSHYVRGLESREPTTEAAYIYCRNFIDYFVSY
jgi:hypothetical protein